MHPDEAANTAEALAAVLTQDQAAVRLEYPLGVLRIDYQVSKVEGAPDHPLALVSTLPGGAAVMRDHELRLRGLDKRVDGLCIARRECEGNAAIGLRWQALVGLRELLRPRLATIAAAIEAATRGGVRSVAAGAEGPALAAEVPQSRKQHIGIGGVHGHAAATCRGVGSLEDQRPGLAAIHRL